MKLNFTRVVILITALLVFNVFGKTAGNALALKHNTALYCVNASSTAYNFHGSRYGFVEPTYTAGLITYKLAASDYAAPLNEKAPSGFWTKLFSVAAITQLFYAVVIVH